MKLPILTARSCVELTLGLEAIWNSGEPLLPPLAG